MGLAVAENILECPLGVTRDDIKGWTLSGATLNTRTAGLEKSISEFAPQLRATREEMVALHATLKTKNGFIRHNSPGAERAEPATVVVQFGRKQWGVLGSFVLGGTLIVNLILHFEAVFRLVRAVFASG